MLADARVGIAYYDDAMNGAYVGTPEAQGGITEPITNALEPGRETGLFKHDVEPAELVAFEIINQRMRGRRQSHGGRRSQGPSSTRASRASLVWLASGAGAVSEGRRSDQDMHEACRTMA